MKYIFLFLVCFVSCKSDVYDEKWKINGIFPLYNSEYPITFSMEDTRYDWFLIQHIEWWNNELSMHWNGYGNPPTIVKYVRYGGSVKVKVVPMVEGGLDGLAIVYYGELGNVITAEIELKKHHWIIYNKCILRHEIGHVLSLDHDTEFRSIMQAVCDDDTYLSEEDAKIIYDDYIKSLWR